MEVAFGATITSGGSGYQIGDVLGISSIGAVNVGTEMLDFHLPTISNINQIIVDNVQGDFVVGVGKNNSNLESIIQVLQHSLNGTGVEVVDGIIEETDGRHIRVDHKNHGMYFSDNLVTIYNAQDLISNQQN
jgi:hypothetical protein